MADQDKKDNQEFGSKLKTMQDLTMLETEDRNMFNKFNKSVEKFASIDSDDMLAALREMAGDDAPSIEEIKKAAEEADEED